MDISLRPELGAHQRLEQTLKLSPAMIQSMEILQLASLDLQEKIEAALEENPVLEIEEPAVEQERETSPEPEPAESKDDSEFSNLEDFSQASDASWEDYERIPKSRYAGGEDPKLEVLQNVEGRPMTLAEHLEGQLTFVVDDPRMRRMALQVVGNLDANGYLIGPLEEVLASCMDWSEPPTSEEFQYALEIVQSLDPPGVGARNLSECLLLQLRREKLGSDKMKRIVEAIVKNFLEDLGKNKLPQIARQLKRSLPDAGEVTVETVNEARRIIATFDPRPGRTFGGEQPNYIRPDVIVEKINGRYEIIVENTYFPRLKIRSEYRSLLSKKAGDADTRKFLKTKFQDAEFLLKALGMRENTLQRIASELVSLQEGFLDNGITHLRPLRLQDVAERLGMHLSTISRAISGKYIQTPRGIFDFKFFFPGGASRKDGESLARNSVMVRLRELIDKEDKKHPLSDEYLTSELKKQGISISRRTVTKYREAEGIPASRERKQF